MRKGESCLDCIYPVRACRSIIPGMNRVALVSFLLLSLFASLRLAHAEFNPSSLIFAGDRHRERGEITPR